MAFIEFVKMLTAATIQAVLDVKLDNELGYSKYDYKNKQTSNSRNSHSRKTVQGNMGELEIAVPRDRDGEFDPQLVKKNLAGHNRIGKIMANSSQWLKNHGVQDKYWGATCIPSLHLLALGNL